MTCDNLFYAIYLFGNQLGVYSLQVMLHPFLRTQKWELQNLRIPAEGEWSLGGGQ